MPPNLDWNKLMTVDPDSLPSRDKLADKLLDSISKVEGNDLTAENPEKLIQLFRITQTLMKMKAQEVELALEEVEKAGGEQAKMENQLKAKVVKLEHEVEMAQMSTGGRDTRFLREEIRQLENQLQFKDRELTEIERELNKEKKISEQLGIRIKEVENENNKIRRENEQLRQDVTDYQRQIDSQRETLLTRRGDEADYRSQLSKKNLELVQYLDEIQNITEANEKLEAQTKDLQRNLEESVQEMEKMTDEYNKMKLIVQHSDSIVDQNRREKEQLTLQVQELTEQLQTRTDEEDPVILAVNEKIEEWKRVLTAKDEEITEYQQILRDLTNKLRTAELDNDKSTVIGLQQIIAELLTAVHERDYQIKILTDQIELHTVEMNRNVLLIDELQSQLKHDMGFPTLHQQSRIGELQHKVNLLEQKIREAERVAELAESDAKEKDQELSEALTRMRAYESGEYGLENAVAEIKECKNHIKIRDHEIEAMIREINNLELKINDLLDENENLRGRLGLNPKDIIDLTEFKKNKNLKQQQYRAENQILLKEIEHLEEERLELKKQIRKLAQDRGTRAGRLGLSADDLQLVEELADDLSPRKSRLFLSSSNWDELKDKNCLLHRELLNKEEQFQSAEVELIQLSKNMIQNEYLSKEVQEKEKEVEQRKIQVAELKAKLKDVVEENKQFEHGMKEILEAIKNTQNETLPKRGEPILKIESLERLVSAIEMKNTKGTFDVNVHLKAQVDQLTGRNDELRQELREARKEAGIANSQMEKANERVTRLENEIKLLHQSRGHSVVFQPLTFPEGMEPSSTDIINSLNEYLVQLLQDISNKEKDIAKVQDAVEEYKRKFAVIRHQQGLLYKEYQSERESWQRDIEKVAEEKKKLEDLKEQDAVKIKQYNQLLETLQMDPDEMKKRLADIVRKSTVLHVNEKSLTRRYTTLLEMEQHLRKENNKLRNDNIAMEVAVSERIGYLQRFKDVAAFKTAALQKALEESVPISDMERANAQYNELTAKYRDLLQKDNLLVQRTSNLENLEGENTAFREDIDGLNKELEITKEKLHTLEQAWEQVNKLGGTVAMDKATKAITNSEIVSISKKITMLEMKELNERQRAEHAHKMCDHMQNTLKQLEERNSELETKFAEITKINLEAQKIEQELRDELAKGVSKAVSDADRKRIAALEKSESELKIEVSMLRDISDVAKMQVGTLEARQQSREKEVAALRRQVLDYQVESDEKALIATLHQHIIALQVSETTAVNKLEVITSKLQKLEACNLRLEHKLDEKEQALYYARLEGRNKAKHLQQTIQSLRRQFSGALPLAQQEKFSKTMVQLQNDKLKIMQEVKRAQEERRAAEDKATELELKIHSLEELIGSLKDARGAQKVTEWHKKMEQLRLEELKLNRCINKQKEELKYLNNIISEQERTINSLEEEMVQQNKFHEERQLIWDQREVELEHQLDRYEKQQNEVLSTAKKFEEATGSIPDPSVPLPEQLDVALQKIRGHIRTILETQGTCRTLEEKLKEKEAALWKAEQNVLSRDRVINELRLRLPATVEREKLIADLGDQKEDNQESRKTLKIAHQTITNMQARLNQKEEVLHKYQHLLATARKEQEEIARKHEEDLKILHQKMDLQADASLSKFKEAAIELMKKPSLPIPTTNHLQRLAEMEQIVAEQDNSLCALTDKLNRATTEAEKHKQITVLKMKEYQTEKAKLEENHAAHVKRLKNEINELKNTILQMEKELEYFKTELEAQKQANTRAPTNTMKHLVERLKSQLALKEKQQKALSKALLDLRAEMTSHAEKQIITSAAQKEENFNVQLIVDKQTKELRIRIEELSNHLVASKENLKACRNKESTMTSELEHLNGELQRKERAANKLQTEKDELDKENEELKKKIKRLCSSMQTRTATDNKQNLIDELQKKVKRLESELGKKTTSEHAERKTVKEDRTSKEEIVRWEEGKKWQARLEGVRNKLKEKEKEVDSMAKQIITLKDLYTKVEQEKVTLQKKLKARGVTVDQVIGIRSMESNKEIEDLKRKNSDLEDQIVAMRLQQALPRDSVVEDLTLKNCYLHEKLQALERQLSKDPFSRPSTSGVGSEAASQKEQELQRENLSLSADNVELRFQLEQAIKDLPRLKDQVGNLQEMCELLRKEKTELARKLGNVRGSGRSGKTIPELEKTIGLMKKVVERVQRENEGLKKAPEVISSQRLSALEMENENLKCELEKLKKQMEDQLSLQYEAKTKGTEKIIAENERLRKELKKEADGAEKLRIAKNNLGILNEKLTVQLEETNKRLNFAESQGPQLEGADSKSWKSTVVSRMFESKVKELETEIAKKNQSLADLKQLLRESNDREKKFVCKADELKEQIELLKQFPDEAKTGHSLVRELQLMRLAYDRLEKEKAALELHHLEIHRMQSDAIAGTSAGYNDVRERGQCEDTYKGEVVELQKQLKVSNVEKQHLQEEIKRLKKELSNFDPSFFEELEDLKFNYRQEVKRNILLEEQIRKLSERFGVEVDIPGNCSSD
ncbi:centrosomal protein of 290 kDa isoform X1 [Callorhinchus milii]|uniref:centrosomal protein of 290 kDa isoform X1 n=1 Tax=Callorhinchus milii TaxID=7868 RepID=UPI001C3FB710|nr:centrosomal protein of 290 kDa isoform X1 [Callorhinchus milii]